MGIGSEKEGLYMGPSPGERVHEGVRRRFPKTVPAYGSSHAAMDLLWLPRWKPPRFQSLIFVLKSNLNQAKSLHCCRRAHSGTIK